MLFIGSTRSYRAAERRPSLPSHTERHCPVLPRGDRLAVAGYHQCVQRHEYKLLCFIDHIGHSGRAHIMVSALDGVGAGPWPRDGWLQER